MPTELHSEHRGNTLLLSFTSGHAPEFSAEMLAACVEALNVAEGMPDIRAVVLCGEDEAFCAGKAPSAIEPALSQLVDAIRACPQPVLAALEGTVSGAASALVWACDLVVASSGSKAVLFDNPWLEPVVRRLPRQVAQQLLWSTEPICSERLHQLGLVNWVTPPGQALEQALRTAEQLESQPARALALSKERLEETFGRLPASSTRIAA